MIRAWSVVSLLLLTAGEGPAREVGSPPVPIVDDGITCVATGYRWRGSLAETAAIRTEPIPASFRRIMDEGGCARFQLIKESLVDWHLAFGDERSTIAALAYLERELLRSAGPAERFAEAARQAWRLARNDVRRVAAAGPGTPEARRLLESSRAIAELRQLASGSFERSAIIRSHLRAAEEYRSPALLDRAQLLLEAFGAGETFLAQAAGEEAGSLLELDDQAFARDELRMRAAVLDASMAPDDASIARASAILDGLSQPDFARLAANAFTGGQDFCDFGQGDPSDEELAAACRQSDHVHERVTAYWVNRAILDLVRGTATEGSGPPLSRDSFETARNLLEHERAPDGERRCCRMDAEEDLRRLLLEAAARQERLLGRSEDAGDHWQEALDLLTQAGQLTPVHEEPQRFRRIAERWLALWARGAGLPSGPNVFDPTHAPSLRRQASYLRAVLADLDRISLGADADPRP